MSQQKKSGKKLPQDCQVSTASGTQEFGQAAAGLRVHPLLRGGKLCTFSLKQHYVEINGVKKGEGRAECRAAAQPSECSGCGAPGQLVFPGVSYRRSDFRLSHGQTMG